jgi:hypothetical protein
VVLKPPEKWFLMERPAADRLVFFLVRAEPIDRSVWFDSG